MVYLVPQIIEIYKTETNHSPFLDWSAKLKDKSALNTVAVRLERLRNGLAGDSKSVGDQVYELRIHTGPGYRLYFSKIDQQIILLLCGGDKSSQSSDIQKSKFYLHDYRQRNAQSLKVDL